MNRPHCFDRELEINPPSDTQCESPVLWISTCAIGAVHVRACAEALAWYALENSGEAIAPRAMDYSWRLR